MAVILQFSKTRAEPSKEPKTKTSPKDRFLETYARRDNEGMQIVLNSIVPEQKAAMNEGEVLKQVIVEELQEVVRSNIRRRCSPLTAWVELRERIRSRGIKF